MDRLLMGLAEASAKGDCVVAELERLKTELRCAPTDDRKLDALRYVVHFVGDIHQPMHTMAEGRGGNDVAVEVRLAGAKTCRGGSCSLMVYRSNLHRVWDGTLIKATIWSWGAYVDRLESGLLPSLKPVGPDDGTPARWAEETHRAARFVWEQLPESRVVDDAYYSKILPTLDRQLGLAGLRLAQFLNDAQAPGQCAPR